MAALVAVTAWLTARITEPVVQPLRFAVVLPESQPFSAQGSDRDLAVTPDGRRIVYRAAVGSGYKLVVRDLTQGSDRVLDGTDFARTPFISSDGQWVGFFLASVLKKVPIGGGPPVTVADFTSVPRGASWWGDTIVLATADPLTGLLSVPAGGGTPTVITKPDNTAGEGDHHAPSFLPDGNRVLFTVELGVQVEPVVQIVDLKTRERRTVLRDGRQPQYVAPDSLVFAVGGTLRAARFDLASAQVLSEPVPVVERLSTPSNYAANYDVSRNGMLVYLSGADGAGTGAKRSLVWVTSEGREESIAVDARAFADPRIGADERQVLVELNDAPDDVWTIDVARGALTRQTFEEGEDETPAWMPDGKTVVYASTRTGVARAVYRRRADGAGGEEQLWSGLQHVHVETPTPDGKALILSSALSNGAQMDLMLLPLEGKREWQPLLQTRFTEFGARLSPDGRWLAYVSDESGRQEVYVRAFPSLEGKMQVSTAGGTQPVWSKRGDELYFQTAEAMMAVRLQAGSAVSISRPRKLFENKYYLKGGTHTGFDVARDGRFLMVGATLVQGAEVPLSNLSVVLNWHEELKTKLK